jgi:hypothetical protein
MPMRDAPLDALRVALRDASASDERLHDSTFA